jgi:hypothetical protein
MSKQTEHFCPYCEKSFSTKYILNRHISDRCTKKQKKEYDEGLIQNKLDAEKISQLERDNKNLSENLENITKEYNICHKKLVDFEKSYENIKNNYENRISELEKFIKDIKNEYELRIIKLECTIEINEKRCDDLKDQLVKFQDSTKEIAIKAIENTGPKTTNTINNRNQIYQALQPLTSDFMQEQRQYLTYQDVKNGAHSIAHFASKHTFKDRVFCSDKSRLNFVFKNENDSIIKDPEGVEITKRFIEINRTELIRLLNEYLKVIEAELDEDIGTVEYKYWAEKREEILTIRSAIINGNDQHNKENYGEFKRGFLAALSDLVPR